MLLWSVNIPVAAANIRAEFICERSSEGNFPETFPKMFTHRFLLAYFFRNFYVLGNF
jgi:hypothetical protein